MALDEDERKMLFETHFAIKSIIEPMLMGDGREEPGLVRRMRRQEDRSTRQDAVVRAGVIVCSAITALLTLAISALAFR